MTSFESKEGRNQKTDAMKLRRTPLLYRPLELDLGNGAVEELALGSGDLNLESGRLAGAVSAGEGTGTPRRACSQMK